MSRGITIADFVQQVLYAMYKVRLDVGMDAAQSFHADTDKFKEIVMEGNFVLQELQQAMDWNWLRSRWTMGVAEATPCGHIMEFTLPETVYKVATGYGDAVRMHHPRNPSVFIEVPFTSPRTGSTNLVTMFDGAGQLNMPDSRLMAFVVGDTLTFTRPFFAHEVGLILETDVVDLLEPLHICSGEPQPCAKAYTERVFTQISDPYYMVVRTAAKRAGGDPSAADQVMALGEEAMKLLSAMRENDSAKTAPDTASSFELGYTRVF